jgi:2-polyprenyl-3-methyl-5-hydroxy-6-metoxy-1,4-benzoquinol methylase
MRVLVAIPSYGTKNQVYLERLLQEYRAMKHAVHVVVFSNIPRDLGPDVEVIVGLPARNPWSLPYRHKQLFAERLRDYDLFIYSEDDILIRQRHVEAFLEVTAVLPETEIAGFLRYEEDAAGRRYCDTIHAMFHWLPASVRFRGPHAFACFTNEHAAAYMLTQGQLRRAISSGGFVVAPHEGRYDMLCSAATDPYTQCGAVKVICLSRIGDFLLHHLSNRYVGQMGISLDELRVQVNALLCCANDKSLQTELLTTVTRLDTTEWDKWYYDQPRQDVLQAVAADARRVLSIGCGAGNTEATLVARGMEVVGIPLDRVVAESARIRGIQLTPPEFEAAFHHLRGERFDVIWLLHVLQYVPEPQRLLRTCAEYLADKGRIVLVVPNFRFLGYRRNGLRDPRLGTAGDPFQEAGLHRTTAAGVARWVADSGVLRITRVRYNETSRFHRLIHAANGLAGPFLARDVLLVAERA